MGERDRVLRCLLAGGLLCILALAAPACGPKTTRYPALLERDLFLCCTMSFNKDLEANDANYRYQTGVLYRAGTPVRVLGDDEGVLLLQLDGGPAVYRLGYRFGKRRLDPSAWHSAILRETDPRGLLARWPAHAVAAVDTGQLAAGLTKAQALAARGHPPFHRTESLDADEWVYYDDPDATDTVVFVNGRIATITRGAPPDRRYETPLTIAPFAYEDPARTR
jgi:hypothetical protein